MQGKPFVAVVDDNRLTRVGLTALLRRAGYDTEGYVDGRDFLDRYTPRHGCVVLNMMMPRLDGLGTLYEMGVRGWDVPVIGTSADPSYREHMLCAGAVLFCDPGGLPEVLAAVRQVLGGAAWLTDGCERFNDALEVGG